ncbi:MAG: hypothetical protein ACJA0N_002394 [Pseudohongiellaceae bacterium]|jgi:hypothetical protein
MVNAIILSCFSIQAVAGIKDDIGYTELYDTLGINTPTGAGFNVTQVEAGSSGSWIPNTDDSQFTGKSISNQSTTSTPTTDYSSHATAVGRYFYGNSSSIATGITTIHSFEAGSWLLDDFLRTNYTSKPLSSSSRIANHSWIGGGFTDNTGATSRALRRVDWVVETDEYLQFVGTSNSGNNQVFLSSAYNVISVGRTDAAHGKTTTSLDDLYIAGRVAPLLVAPATTTSSATPIAASAAAVLIENGHTNTAFSNGSTNNRANATIYNAERSEVITALLMAGADRKTLNTTSSDIVDYVVDAANQTDNGLDRRYGAGQVNVYNSYNMQSSGEHDSQEDGNSNNAVLAGFDYDSSFGGSKGSNSIASYRFSALSAASKLQASLAWNLEIDGGSFTFNETATLYNLDLELIDLTLGSAVALSDSSIENTENLYLNLLSGHEYELRVTNNTGSNFEWDYGLAWQIVALQAPTVTIDSPASASTFLSSEVISFGASAFDPEDGDLSENIQWLSSLDGALGSSSLLTTQLSIGSHTITASVTDEDGLTETSTPSIQLTILADPDLDGIEDSLDNCPTMSNSDQLDNDTDGVGNVCDDDIDGDLIPNTVENLYGLDSYDASDALLDLDNDGRSNVTEYFDGGVIDVADTGDVNGDGEISIADLLLLERFLTQIISLDTQQVSRADFNQDTKLDIRDLLLFEQNILN